MLLWKAALCALLSALAYTSIALALLRLFRGQPGQMLGRLRWTILGMLAAEAFLQALLVAGIAMRGSISGNLALGAGAMQLAIGISLWPFLHGMDQRLARAVGRRARARLAQAAQHTSDAEIFLEMAARVANFGHWRIDPASQTLEWSEEMFRIHGMAQNEPTPGLLQALEMFHPDDRRTVTNALEVVHAGGGDFELKIRLRRPNTELRHVIMRGTAQPNGTVVGVLLDITDQKAAEARTREANAVALQANAALREMTLEDGLTGLSNRRQFDLSLVHEFKRAVRSSTCLGLVMIDVDHFRGFNELYGQQAGDVCLRAVCQAVKKVPRRTGDIIARYSGEQIAILLPLADEDGAMRVATVIFEAVQALAIVYEGSETGLVSVSGGVAAFTGVADMNNPLDLVRRADQALDKAKQEGRGRVVKFEAGMNADLREPYGRTAETSLEAFIKSRA